MDAPAFKEIQTDNGVGLTYDCGCPCDPAALPTAAGPGFEHCCCGKVHFVGLGARNALAAYLAERAARRRREPKYDVGSAMAVLAGAPVEVAWAFPVETS